MSFLAQQHSDYLVDLVMYRRSYNFWNLCRSTKDSLEKFMKRTFFSIKLKWIISLCFFILTLFPFLVDSSSIPQSFGVVKDEVEISYLQSSDFKNAFPTTTFYFTFRPSGYCSIYYESSLKAMYRKLIKCFKFF